VNLISVSISVEMLRTGRTCRRRL